MRGIANRRKEFDLFERMVRGKTSHRIILIEGPSERGKSTLLMEFAALAEEIHNPGCCARIDLRGTLLLAEIFSRFYTELGKEVFASYSRVQAANQIHVNVDANMSGARFRDDNQVCVRPIIHSSSADSQNSSGDALIHDLCAYAKPLVLIIDTFESATDDASRWITHQLLPAAHKNKQLYIVLGGKNVPDYKIFQLTLGKLTHYHILDRLDSVEDWHEFAQTRHPKFPRDQIEMLCRGGLTERPSAINIYIETISRQLPPHLPSNAAS
jgi:hypothetical protein